MSRLVRFAYTAATPWTTIPQNVLDRTCFWHLMTNTPVHPKEPEVLKLIPKGGHVMLSIGVPGSLNTQPRLDGYIQAIKDSNSGVTYDVVNTGPDPATVPPAPAFGITTCEPSYRT